MKVSHLALGVTGALLFSQQGWSVGYEKPIFWSGKYSGTGGAAVSSVNNADALYFNPAGLAKSSSGTEAILNFSPTITKMSAPVLVANTPMDSKSSFSPIGSVMLSHQVAPGFGVGLGLYTAGGLGVDYGDVNVGATYPALLKTKLSDMEVSLGAGLQVHPMLSLGAAWRISMFSADFTSLNGSTGINSRFLSHSGSQWSGFRFGAQFGPEDGNWGLGAALRTSVALKGTGTGTAYSVATGTETSIGVTSLETSLPLQASLGGHFMAADDIKILLQYDFTQYVNNRTLDITVAGVLTKSAMNWKNRQDIRVGGEYTGLKNWPVRLGYVYTSAVTPTDYPNPYFTPPGAVNTFTLGTGTQIATDLTLDGALDYTVGSATGTPNASAGTLAGVYKATAYALHTGLSYRF